MNTLQAFGRNLAARGRETMVFDWDKAARLILEKKPKEASAGLRSDWEWTGGGIWSEGKPVKDDYTYLSSTWATPELDLDGDVVECFRPGSEVPDWGPNTKWPASALAILGIKEE